MSSFPTISHSSSELVRNQVGTRGVRHSESHGGGTLPCNSSDVEILHQKTEICTDVHSTEKQNQYYHKQSQNGRGNIPQITVSASSTTHSSVNGNAPHDTVSELSQLGPKQRFNPFLKSNDAVGDEPFDYMLKQLSHGGHPDDPQEVAHHHDKSFDDIAWDGDVLAAGASSSRAILSAQSGDLGLHDQEHMNSTDSHLQDLEREQALEFLRNNLKGFGFPESLKVEPLADDSVPPEGHSSPVLDIGVSEDHVAQMLSDGQQKYSPTSQEYQSYVAEALAAMRRARYGRLLPPSEDDDDSLSVISEKTEPFGSDYNSTSEETVQDSCDELSDLEIMTSVKQSVRTAAGGKNRVPFALEDSSKITVTTVRGIPHSDPVNVKDINQNLPYKPYHSSENLPKMMLPAGDANSSHLSEPSETESAQDDSPTSTLSSKSKPQGKMLFVDTTESAEEREDEDPQMDKQNDDLEDLDSLDALARNQSTDKVLVTDLDLNDEDSDVELDSLIETNKKYVTASEMKAIILSTSYERGGTSKRRQLPKPVQKAPISKAIKESIERFEAPKNPTKSVVGKAHLLTPPPATPPQTNRNSSGIGRRGDSRHDEFVDRSPTASVSDLKSRFNIMPGYMKIPTINTSTPIDSESSPRGLVDDIQDTPTSRYTVKELSPVINPSPVLCIASEVPFKPETDYYSLTDESSSIDEQHKQNDPVVTESEAAKAAGDWKQVDEYIQDMMTNKLETISMEADITSKRGGSPIEQNSDNKIQKIDTDTEQPDMERSAVDSTKTVRKKDPVYENIPYDPEQEDMTAECMVSSTLSDAKNPTAMEGEEGQDLNRTSSYEEIYSTTQDDTDQDPKSEGIVDHPVVKLSENAGSEQSLGSHSHDKCAHSEISCTCGYETQISSQPIQSYLCIDCNRIVANCDHSSVTNHTESEYSNEDDLHESGDESDSEYTRTTFGTRSRSKSGSYDQNSSRLDTVLKRESRSRSPSSSESGSSSDSRSHSCSCRSTEHSELSDQDHELSCSHCSCEDLYFEKFESSEGRLETDFGQDKKLHKLGSVSFESLDVWLDDSDTAEDRADPERLELSLDLGLHADSIDCVNAYDLYQHDTSPSKLACNIDPILDNQGDGASEECRSLPSGNMGNVDVDGKMSFVTIAHCTSSSVTDTNPRASSPVATVIPISLEPEEDPGDLSNTESLQAEPILESIPDKPKVEIVKSQSSAPLPSENSQPPLPITKTEKAKKPRFKLAALGAAFTPHKKSDKKSDKLPGGEARYEEVSVQRIKGDKDPAPSLAEPVERLTSADNPGDHEYANIDELALQHTEGVSKGGRSPAELEPQETQADHQHDDDDEQVSVANGRLAPPRSRDQNDVDPGQDRLSAVAASDKLPPSRTPPSERMRRQRDNVASKRTAVPSIALAADNVSQSSRPSEDENIDELFASHASMTSYTESNVTKHSSNLLSPFSTSRESIASFYSDAGEGNYGIPVTGDILFGLDYNYKNNIFEVSIKMCRDLAPVDVKRKRSDPYIKTYLLPDKTKNGKRKTRVKKHTLNPTYDETLKYHITKSELENRTLAISVWHNDTFGRNNFLGEVSVPMDDYSFSNSSPKWHQLMERHANPMAKLAYKGDLVISLKFVTSDHLLTKKRGRAGERGELHVLIKEAQNLMAVRSNGSSDPFCKGYLLPEKTKSSKQKTAVKKRDCNPKWNHTFVFEDIALADLKEKCLELTVWDHDRFTTNDFLGGVRLSLGVGTSGGREVDWMDSKGEEISMWQSMLDRPNCWIEGTLLLRPSMDRRL